MNIYTAVFTNTNYPPLVFAAHSKSELTNKVRNHVGYLILKDQGLKTDLIADADLYLLCDWIRRNFKCEYYVSVH